MNFKNMLTLYNVVIRLSLIPISCAFYLHTTYFDSIDHDLVRIPFINSGFKISRQMRRPYHSGRFDDKNPIPYASTAITIRSSSDTNGVYKQSVNGANYSDPCTSVSDFHENHIFKWKLMLTAIENSIHFIIDVLNIFGFAFNKNFLALRRNAIKT